MSFGSLKTLKLERTLGDATLSITKQVPTDADESDEFHLLDVSIIQAAHELAEFCSSNMPPVIKTKAELPTTVVEAPVKEVAKPKNKKGGGRPVGSKAKAKTKVEETPVVEEKIETPTLKPAKKEKLKTVAKVIETLVNQDEKVELVKSFQQTFENEVGFASEDTYMTEFNNFLTSLISMDYKTYLEADITEAQLATFKDLI